jgi:hypothetical protein
MQSLREMIFLEVTFKNSDPVSQTRITSRLQRPPCISDNSLRPVYKDALYLRQRITSRLQRPPCISDNSLRPVYKDHPYLIKRITSRLQRPPCIS